MKITACWIVKDNTELEMLKRSVSSIVDYVDTINITANGKKTGKIRKWCEDNGHQYSYYKWDDNFSNARNYNFKQAPSDTDYLFWMDADDYLVGAEYLPEIARLSKESNKEVVFLTYWYAAKYSDEPSPESLVEIDIEHMRERLIKPGAIVWKGRLHETPIPVTGSREAFVKFPYEKNKRPIAILHLKDFKDFQDSVPRNKKLLELQLQDEKQTERGPDPRTLLYLMKIYSDSNDLADHKKSITYGEQYLEKSGWGEERAVCYNLMAKSKFWLGEHQEIVDLLLQAIKEYPHFPLYYLRLAEAYYNLKKHREAKHWLKLGLSIEIDNKSLGVINMNEMKLLAADLSARVAFEVDKDTKSALEFAKVAYEQWPSKRNEDRYNHILDYHSLNQACKNFHELIKYYEDVGETKLIPKIIQDQPLAIKKQPFAIKYLQKYTPPKVWGSKEICYFASLGGKHFEEWGPSSLDTGIGGSETAVIKLSKYWVSKGYQVTVYGDPGSEMGKHDGVIYLPHYMFNMNDYFNIFIQWRSSFLADKIKAKTFLVDMHDLYNPVDLVESEPYVDKFMFKSEYHAGITSAIETDNYEVIGNGI
jgi:tetratricopeptide (TPR) repeat protein